MAVAASDGRFAVYVVLEVVNTVFLPRFPIPLHIFPFNLVCVCVDVWMYVWGVSVGVGGGRGGGENGKIKDGRRPN